MLPFGSHPHIQWSVISKTEPSLRCIKLIRRNPKIKERSVNLCPTKLLQGFFKLAVFHIEETNSFPILGKIVFCKFKSKRIPVQRAKLAVRGSIQNGFCMAAHPHGSIKIKAIFPGMQSCKNFFSQYRYMHCFKFRTFLCWHPYKDNCIPQAKSSSDTSSMGRASNRA